ncbi:VPLPA-CTERM sorting domain-containing protein [Citreicella sp. C3M06]|uniref:VPLPA-CTERM sorting domain-containing protein n=1 Tax=Citreicella sp. C3M06 TaxID=2841564 RepID=UPI001C08E422|nr:VPLPA-CTERM sorting domain-containing protein [Citreicella sp. C3M06]MBU2961843.1 VPLPA-CTERM sorting domain-containing protein [Citreicella sp. C3M06]
MSYYNVADGINATLTSDSSFVSGNASKNGSVDDDIRVNTNAGTVNLTLSLFDSTVGDGFESLYDPGVDYDWTLAFYDIDGYDPTGSWYETVTVYADAASELTYTVTETTALDVTSGSGSVTFSAVDAPAVKGQDGLNGELTDEQSSVAAIIGISNTSVLDFSFTIVDNRDSNSSSRNLLIDGGNISLASATVTTPIAPVPLPAAGLLMIAAMATMGVASRRSRKS